MLDAPLPAASHPHAHAHHRRMAPAIASWYGPGLYGNPLACPGAGVLAPGTVAVAHKTLPCGRKVRLCFRRRCTTAPVLDRGPFVAGRDFDLTDVVRARLGMPRAVKPVRWRLAA